MINLHWRPNSDLSEESATALGAQLQEILERWEGTPYVEGMQGEGQGVDCVRFVYAALDERRGFERRDPTTLPQDSAMHNAKGAFRVMRGMCERYPHVRVLDGSLEPSDVVVMGPSDGGPGHAMIVGPKRWQIWHSTELHVHYTGRSYLLSKGRKVFRVYRMTSKEKWPWAAPQID